MDLLQSGSRSMYELVIRRVDASSYPAVWYTDLFGNISHAGDLYKPQPRKHRLWNHVQVGVGGDGWTQPSRPSCFPTSSTPMRLSHQACTPSLKSALLDTFDVLALTRAGGAFDCRATFTRPPSHWLTTRRQQRSSQIRLTGFLL